MHEAEMGDYTAHYDIFTAASVDNEHGSGSWGALIVRWAPLTPYHRVTYRSLRGGSAETSPDRLELLAMLASLALVPAAAPVRLITKKQRIQHGLSVELERWCMADWRNAGGQPLTHRELWERLEAERQGHPLACLRARDFVGPSLFKPAHELASRAARNYHLPQHSA
jgi:ribonuclease HI